MPRVISLSWAPLLPTPASSWPPSLAPFMSPLPGTPPWSPSWPPPSHTLASPYLFPLRQPPPLSSPLPCPSVRPRRPVPGLVSFLALKARVRRGETRVRTGPYPLIFRPRGVLKGSLCLSAVGVKIACLLGCCQ